ncbi:hypothetical protein AYR62_13600 [Secundilactobacillus paracollinoides]|uniref:Uncharacterized protein n=1 Tax=Secundilactobacillus paracollinoides TaxID=240427 RepID=A0A1B2IWR5_9LACO|nr:hypothetical protein [Secundilactobacillus paracollinoides]ANZ60637.1 hypothetical protein AYR61_04295 [Secundilactobacillus paracollinoides]ANZ65010.1 hypothetical protein AYR62_13600 [Secundilactobacillus paracollinoides]ANZ66480.1 hypothetical protein AYR63_04580 [Secundilactobacillus paracollinoides]
MGKRYRHYNQFMNQIGQPTRDLMIFNLSTAGAFVLTWFAGFWALKQTQAYMQGDAAGWFLIFGGFIFFIPVLTMPLISWGLGVTTLVMTIHQNSQLHHPITLILQWLAFGFVFVSGFLLLTTGIWVLWLNVIVYCVCAVGIVFETWRDQHKTKPGN